MLSPVRYVWRWCEDYEDGEAERDEDERDEDERDEYERDEDEDGRIFVFGSYDGRTDSRFCG